MTINYKRYSQFIYSKIVHIKNWHIVKNEIIRLIFFIFRNLSYEKVPEQIKTIFIKLITLLVQSWKYSVTIYEWTRFQLL